jgi:hypothetical protein
VNRESAIGNRESARVDEDASLMWKKAMGVDVENATVNWKTAIVNRQWLMRMRV